MDWSRKAPDKRSSSLAPRVLVVESDVLIRMTVSAYLRAGGFNVFEVSSADEAMQVLKSDFKIDVALVDLVSPDNFAGFTIARWIRRERASIKVILTSGVRRVAKDADDLYEHGPAVDKPPNRGDLERRIRQLLAHSPASATAIFALRGQRRFP